MRISTASLLCLAAAAVSAVPFQQQTLQTRFIDTLSRPVKHLDALTQHIASLPEQRRVRLQDYTEHDITEGEKSLLVYNGIRFEDITEEVDLPIQELVFRQPHDLPSNLSYTAKDLQPYFDNISTKRMKETMIKFTSFYTRHYRSPTGKESQKWLLAQVQAIADSNKSLGIKVSEFPHPWGQNSIIAHFPRNEKATGKDQRVIVAAHQDSTNLLPFLAAPGADDDGSGTTTVLEVMHALVEGNFVPHNSSVELHWYSAEEGGLLGSAQVANTYHADKIPVRAMLQQDMTAYIKPGTEARIGVIEDFVSPELTELLEQMVHRYTDVKPVRTACGYACSDHASFTKIGVPSAFVIEATFEDSNTGNIHSTRDKYTVDGFSFDHMARFARMSIAFANELSA